MLNVLDRSWRKPGFLCKTKRTPKDVSAPGLKLGLMDFVDVLETDGTFMSSWLSTD